MFGGLVNVAKRQSTHCAANGAINSNYNNEQHYTGNQAIRLEQVANGLQYTIFQ